MLPLSSKDGDLKPKFSSLSGIVGWIKLNISNVLFDKNTRSIFLFLCLNASFAFVELFYGIYSNSLGLISDAFHMFFDCTALLAGLMASIVAKWKANDRYTYGYVRAEIMAGFVNALFLFFIALNILAHAVERLVEPPEVKHERLLVVSILGFFVNLVGIYFFHEHHGGGHHNCSHSHDHGHHHHDHDHHHHNDHHHHDHHHHDHHHHDHHHGHTHDEHSAEHSQSQIMHGVFLHILADTLGSVGVIISALLMEWYGWMMADPICSLMIGILIAISCWPLLTSSIAILMQRVPTQLDNSLFKCHQSVERLEGVYRVHEIHFWTLCSDVYVGTIKVQISPTADARYVQQQAQLMYSSVGIKQLYVQLDFSDM